jgi:hypothetical protein
METQGIGYTGFPRRYLLPPVSARRPFGHVLKLLEQTYPPKKPDIYCKGNNYFVHLFRL